MKPFLRFIFSAVILLLFLNNVYAQVAITQMAFNTYAQKNLHEKIYIHTDKDFYLTGEILWMKLYYVNGANNKALQLSKVAYVELIDKNQVPVIQAKIAIDKGTGNGSLYIPVDLSNGNYKLRAYTNWMKNFGADYYFEKQISVINPLKTPDKVVQAIAQPDYDVQLFPEGGNLLNGVTNKIAYKITGADGKGINTAGAVVNQRGDTIVRFKPKMFGMGSFLLSPAANDSYRAVFKSNGKAQAKALPQASARGYSMMLSNRDAGRLDVRVSSTNTTENIYLVANNLQTVSVVQTVNLDDNSAVFTIDKNKLADGITHLTVFNSSNLPVAERLYFKRPQHKLTVKIATTAVYGTRKKAAVAFSTSNESGKPVAADLSMTVHRIDSAQKINDNDIQSYLWLTSELKGAIESPGYYFKNENAETDEALDNLLLTQGWRRFDWNSITKSNTPAMRFLPEYNGHIINAKLTDATGTAAHGIVGYLGIPGKRVQMYPALSDSAGRLMFSTRDMYGPGEIVVQTNTEKDSTYHIEVQTPFSDRYAANTYPTLQASALPQSLLESYSLSVQVQNLYASANTRQFYDPGIDSSAFYFRPYKTYKLDDYTRFTTMEEVLREYITEINILKSKNRYHVRTLGEAGIIGDNPLLIMDGVPIFNPDKIIATDPLKIRKLEVVNKLYFYGPTVNEGIFSFITYKGDLGGLELDPHAVVLDYEGMQLQRRFYSPVYDSDAQVKSHLPDFRNVLYWLPQANTGADGKNQASFYTSDQQGKYIAVIEGITPTGEAGSGYVIFEVKK